MALINKYIGRYGGLKVFSVMLLGLLILNIIIVSIIDFNQKTFVIDGLGFKYDSVSNGTWYFKDENGATLKAYNKEGKRNLTIFNGTLIFEYKDKIIRQVKDFESMTSKIYVNELLIYEEDLILVSFNDGDLSKESSRINEIFEVRLIREVIDAVHDISETGVINLFLFSCFLSLLGSSQIAFPKGYWYFKYSLVVEGGEPSDFFIFMTQISGLLLIAAGLIMLLFFAF